jgi:succinate dehydrogenase / fumarate reductase flavoprotein subunit
MPELLRAYGARLSAPASGKKNKQNDEPLSLDLSAMAPEIAERLIGSLGPTLSNLLGVDLTRDSVNVQSRAALGLGGLWVDSDPSGNGFSPREHATSVIGLYAAGSATAEYHGALCLPGNLAPADLLGGQRAARGVIAYRDALKKSAFDLPKSVFEKRATEAESDFEALFKRESRGSGEHPHALFEELKLALTRGCGPERSAEGLEELQETLELLEQKLARATLRGPSVGLNQDALALASLPDSLSLARCIQAAALARDESRGTHVRSDFAATKEGLRRPSWLRAGRENEPEPIQSFDYECAGESVSISNG